MADKQRGGAGEGLSEQMLRDIRRQRKSLARTTPVWALVAVDALLREITRLAERERAWQRQNEVLRAQLAEQEAHRIALMQEVDRLTNLLDRDQTGMASAIAHMVQTARSRAWLMEGRGPYEWDDEDYQKEAGWALTELIQIGETALADSGTYRVAAWAPQRDQIAQLTAEREQWKAFALDYLNDHTTIATAQSTIPAVVICECAICAATREAIQEQRMSREGATL